MTGKIVGLYSFPKSGNSWMRHVFAALGDHANAQEAVPEIYQNDLFITPLTIGGDQFHIYKSHGKVELEDHQKQAVHHDAIIYIIRQPLDVFLSQLNHISKNVTGGGAQDFSIPCDSVDEIKARGHLGAYLEVFSLLGTLQPRFQFAGSWFENTKYWLEKNKSDSRVVVLRYENLLDDPVPELAKLKAIMPVNETMLRNALDKAALGTTQNGKFYWKQRKDNYLEYLSPTEIDRFYQMHKPTLHAAGY